MNDDAKALVFGIGVLALVFMILPGISLLEKKEQTPDWLVYKLRIETDDHWTTTDYAIRYEKIEFDQRTNIRWVTPQGAEKEITTPGVIEITSDAWCPHSNSSNRCNTGPLTDMRESAAESKVEVR